MADNDLELWKAQDAAVVPSSAIHATEIVHCARQLTKRETEQIIRAFDAGDYEMVASFVWSKTMAAMKKQLATLGPELIGKMLGRADLNESSQVESSITDFDTIRLAEDLGVVSATVALRMRHAFDWVQHFSGEEISEEERLTRDEALGCLRACVQGILGQPKMEVAPDFARFSQRLESESLGEDNPVIETLVAAPYFQKRTTINVLLALLKTAVGAQLDHAVANITVLLPAVWDSLRKTERWQVGQTYAEVHADGRTTATKGLGQALVSVHGFDYVPENLRSNTFTKAARAVLQAHEGYNNFYNEPAPMRTLESLGTSIPMPAFPICMSAVLSVHLGNPWGISRAAQDSAGTLLKTLTEEKWFYYLSECLPGDDRILAKLQHSAPRTRWMDLAQARQFSKHDFGSSIVGKLVGATLKRDVKAIEVFARAVSSANGYSAENKD